MKKEILVQRFVFAEIEPFQNYSRLSDKPKNNLNTFDVELIDDGFEDLLQSSSVKSLSSLSEPLIIESKQEYKFKNTKYFYSGEISGAQVALKPIVKDKLPYLTTSDRQIKSHFGDPFSRIKTHIHERVIILNGDKLTVKLDHYTKFRNVNCRFYKKKPYVTGFTLNIKTGDIVTFVGVWPNMKIRKNSLMEMSTSLEYKNLLNYESIILESNSKKDRLQTDHYINFYKEYRETLNDSKFILTLYNTINELFPIPAIKHNVYDASSNAKWLIKSLLVILIDKKKIKVPNEYYKLMISWYPTMAYLKKNDNKLIAAILDRVKIKSKTTIKIMHEYPFMDLRVLLRLVTFFGFEDFHKYVSNIDPTYFNLPTDFIRSGGYSSHTNYETTKEYLNRVFKLHKDERGNILKLINEFLSIYLLTKVKSGSGIDGKIIELIDHCSMITTLRETYYPDIKFNATTWKEFETEHIELSQIVNRIKKGYTIEYIFDEKLVEYVEEPIPYDGEIFYPVLLKTDDEYTEEGTHMHHCVGTYSNKEMSIIISLRVGSPGGHERVTCEFDTVRKQCLQGKHFCNKMPPENFIEPLNELKMRINQYGESIKSKEKKKTTIIINGVPVSDTKLLPLNNNDMVLI